MKYIHVVSYDFCKGEKRKKEKNLFSMSTESFHMSSGGNEKQNRGERMIQNINVNACESICFKG